MNGQREQQYNLARKVGMINLWRKRCTAFKQIREVNPADCAVCDAVAKEISEDIAECTVKRAFDATLDKAVDIASNN